MTRWPFWFGFLLPFLALYMFDWIVFVITFYSLFKHRRNIANQTNVTGSGYSNTKETLIIASSLAVLFGLGWGFGLLATSSSLKEITIAFQVFFSIFVGLQGILLFILHGVRSVEARRVWKKWAVAICGKSCLVLYTRSSTSGVLTKSFQTTRKISGTVHYRAKEPSVRIDNINQNKSDLGFDTNQNGSCNKQNSGSKTFITSEEVHLSTNLKFSDDGCSAQENIYDNPTEQNTVDIRNKTKE